MSVTVVHFHQLWAELHRRPSSIPHSAFRDPHSELIWLDRFANRIRCNGCRNHWLEIIAKDPPPFSDLRPPTSDLRRSYFAWTVRVHNAINRLLGKPIITLRAAKKLWKFASPASDF